MSPEIEPPLFEWAVTQLKPFEHVEGWSAPIVSFRVPAMDMREFINALVGKARDDTFDPLPGGEMMDRAFLITIATAPVLIAVSDNSKWMLRIALGTIALGALIFIIWPSS